MDNEIKQELKNLHRQLIAAGYYKTGRLVLTLLRTGSIFLSDGNNEAYQSGAADCLIQTCGYSNRKFGCHIYAR